MSLRIGPLTFDRERRQLLRGAEEVRLSPKAWRLLDVLVEKRPKALSKAELYEELWPDTFVQEVNLANLVSEVRQAIGDDARRPTYLRTVHGFGYAFAAEPPRADPSKSEEPAIVFRLVWGGTEIDLVEGENVFGRDRLASIWLVDESVSRRHARIVIAGDAATLEDLGSKNGTRRGEEAVTRPVPLQSGDVISIGSVSMTLRVVSTTASTKTENEV
ncbi:MAG TPA: FHA domain-containing protein [Thermoanaerobaculia bacterium]|nr:FHA domain-containing protein [Thermoanaerobaculia bacterium]